MQYAKLKEDGTYDYQITIDGNIVWDQNNFCSASALVKDGKAAQFSVVELHEAEPPAINPVTHSVMRDGGEFVNGRWQYKWRVDELSPEQVATNVAAQVEQLKAAIVNAVQSRLDNFARARNYDGILSACTYANSTVLKFQSEGQYCVQARDATWARLYELMAEVEGGTRPMPASYADVESELPALVWPQ